MNKNKLYQALAVIAIVLLVFSGLSRIISRNSLTLAQYAEQIAESDTPSSENGTGQNPPPGSAGTASAAASAEDETADSEVVSPERVIFQEDFYYEPLSVEAIAGMSGSSYPREGTEDISYADLRYVHVLHYNFEGETAYGELICNKAIAQDLVEIFYELYKAEYQIEKMVLIDQYGGDDIQSMEDNNTSCFNYRKISESKKLSMHAMGLAIDINPLYNPHITYNKDNTVNISPAGGEAYADRTLAFPYKIDETDLCYRLFIEHGFTWGGNWNSSKDYQHFQKSISE